MEYLIHKFMNIVAAPFALLALFFFLPPFLFFKSLHRLWRALFSENVAGKIVLITGASSGIGEHLAYEYAKRGACLALVDRREKQLREVAAMAEEIGSPEAIAITGDVTDPRDCQRFVYATLNHFGQLDHLVANAGLSRACLFEDIDDVNKLSPTMEVNFWGAVYSTYYARPHLERSNGKVIVIGSCASFMPLPRTSIYNMLESSSYWLKEIVASKAAVVNMFGTLRIEMGHRVGVTIVNPGFIQSEMTGGKFITQSGEVEVDEQMRKAVIGSTFMPLEPGERCAKVIVNAACRGDKYLIEPAWYNALLYFKVFCPDVIELSNRVQLILSRSVLNK